MVEALWGLQKGQNGLVRPCMQDLFGTRVMTPMLEQGVKVARTPNPATAHGDASIPKLSI